MSTPSGSIAKRAVDVAVSAMALIAGAPLFALIALLIRMSMGSPILFRHQRPGLRERAFTLYKFRTMSEARDAKGELLPNARRLTRLGRVLRLTSLDELPQLVNVLTGDMSLVGPRPLLPAYLDLYTADQRRRHHAKPGITGWAQVNGRNDLGFDEKMKLDLWYVDHWSLWLDIRILLETIPRIMLRRGIGTHGKATTGRFDPETHRHPDEANLRPDA